MPMPEVLYDLLKEKLSDSKVKVDEKEVSFLSIIEDWYDKFEGTSGILAKNKELLAEKKSIADSLKEKEKELQTATKNFEDAKKKLDAAVAGQLTEAERSQWMRVKEKGMTEEAEIALNTARKEAEDLRAKVTELVNEKTKLSEQYSNVTQSVAQESLKSKIISKLSDFGITGRRAIMAYMDLVNSGSMKIVASEDGTFKEQYHKTTPEGKTIDSSFETILKDYATSEENAYLRSGSPSGGTGFDHRSPQGGGAGGARPSSAEMLRSSNKGYDQQTK